MSNTRKPRKAAAPAPAPTPEELPPVPSVDELTFDNMWLIKAATGIDVLDAPVRGLAIAASLWFATQGTARPLTWDEAKSYRLDDVEIGLGTDLDEAAPRDEEGDLDVDEDEDPMRGSETPSSA